MIITEIIGVADENVRSKERNTHIYTWWKGS